MQGLTNTLYPQVIKVLQERGISQAELARQMNVTRQVVGRKLKYPNPTIKTIEEFATALGVSAADLWPPLAGYNSEGRRLAPLTVRVGSPIVDPSVGTPFFDLLEIGTSPLFWRGKPGRRVSVPGTESCAFSFRHTGDSMAPEVGRGAVIFCEESADPVLANPGEMYLVVTATQRLLRYVETVTETGLLLRATNERYPQREVAFEDIEGIFSVAAVVNYLR